jgi:hypothetical protein
MLAFFRILVNPTCKLFKHHCDCIFFDMGAYAPASASADAHSNFIENKTTECIVAIQNTQPSAKVET